MSRSDAILGKHSTVSITTDEGSAETFPISLSFDDEAVSEPEKVHYMGHFNPSHIPDTGTLLSATFVTTDRSGEFDDFYKRRITKRNFDTPYPDISIRVTTNYNNGTSKVDNYRRVLFTKRSKKRQGDTHQELNYSIIMDPDDME